MWRVDCCNVAVSIITCDERSRVMVRRLSLKAAAALAAGRAPPGSETILLKAAGSAIAICDMSFCIMTLWRFCRCEPEGNSTSILGSEGLLLFSSTLDASVKLCPFMMLSFAKSSFMMLSLAKSSRSMLASISSFLFKLSVGAFLASPALSSVALSDTGLFCNDS